MFLFLVEHLCIKRRKEKKLHTSIIIITNGIGINGQVRITKKKWRKRMNKKVNVPGYIYIYIFIQIYIYFTKSLCLDRFIVGGLARREVDCMENEYEMHKFFIVYIAAEM